MSAASSAGAGARRAAASETMDNVARYGLAARALVYLMLGVLAVLLVFDKSTKGTDQRGALQQLSEQSGGFVVLLIIAVGLSAYALWRFSEAAFGVAGEGKKTGARLQSLARGLIYAVLAASAFTILVRGRDSSQGKDQQSMTAKVMQNTGGRWLVGLVGVVIVVIGFVVFYEGVTRKFEKYFKLGEMSHAQRRTVEVMGTIGTCARGVVYALAGGFVVAAAVTFDPSKARGIDRALRGLRDATGGPVLLFLVALGLVVFGLYGFCEARWRRV